MLSFIWAEDKNGLIGANGTLPWHLPDDMKFFKKTTTGNPIIAGARTFHSFKRPLPNRQNIVLSKHGSFPDGVLVISSIDQLCELVDQYPGKNYIVVGGASIFEQLLDRVDRLYRTKIDHVFQGDTYMPKVDYTAFKQIQSLPGIVDDKNRYPHTFELFERR